MWAAEEVRALLPDQVEGAAEGTTLGDVFMHHYGVKEDGNVSPRKVRGCADLTRSIAAPEARGSKPCGPGNVPRAELSLQDLHKELQGKNVLIVRSSPELTAARFGLQPGQLSAVLQEGRHRLQAARAQRPRPHLDTKMLASWNGAWIYSRLCGCCWCEIVLCWAFLFSSCQQRAAKLFPGAACLAGLGGMGLRSVLTTYQQGENGVLFPSLWDVPAA